MKKQIKVICIILAGLIAVSAVAGSLFYVFNRYNKKDFSILKLPANENNYVDFNDGVHIASNSLEIQKNFKAVDLKDNEYTIFYEKDIPKFFNDIKNDEIFCIYPDSNANESFFALGFCGKLSSVDNSKKTVSFKIPELTDVFSDIYINTSVGSNSNVISTAFYPSDNITSIRDTNLKPSSTTLACATVNPLPLSATKAVGVKESMGFKIKEPSKTSLLDDYTLLSDKLSLKFKCKLSDDDGFSLGANGDVTLEETAVKMLLDYHYDESTDTVKINDYSLGFITKQKVNLSLSAEQSFGLDDLDFDVSEKAQIIDIEDVTESEKGKIVLGTYLIGWQLALPILENNANKVSYLSLGIAIQLTITASGELSLEYNIEESGFAQIEVNGNGDNKYLIKGYDYPNPVIESREPTSEESTSAPTVTSSIKGEAKFDVALGGDIGICILGMIPIKQTNNFVELEITKTFVSEEQKDKEIEFIKNNYLLDDNVDSLILSSNSYLKIHLGAKMNFGGLKYSVGEIDSSTLLFKEIWYQTPSPVGFSHSQCGFGGVFVGETYSDEELNYAFKEYMKNTDKDSIITTAKDSLFGSIVNTAINNLNIDPLDIASYIGEDVEDYKINYFTSGIIYVRNTSDKVVAVFVTGEEITNICGMHNGLSKDKIEQVYSSPDISSGIDLKIGTLARALFNADWIDDTNVSRCTYNSSDSDEIMDMIFCDDSLKMIVIK